MNRIRCLQVDAFTDKPFHGNPAAICLLDHTMTDDWMQSVATEMNLAETAFVESADDGFRLRWFTPTEEADLCGHATLAAAHVLWSEGHVPPTDSIRFHSKGGVLTCSQNNGWISLDFPALACDETEPPANLLDALGIEQTAYIGRNNLDFLIVVANPQNVHNLNPDMRLLKQSIDRGVIVSAKSDTNDCDFISRFFAPAAGIDEDPVTGSAHCCLGPYWSDVLGKTEVVGYQASARGGTVHVTVKGDRVSLNGQAVTTFEGFIIV